MRVIINAVFFQLTWFSFVLNIYEGYLALVSLFFMFVYSVLVEGYQKQHIIMSFCVVVLGLTVDTLLTFFGVFYFSGNTYFFIPFWLVGIWGAFSLTLNSSLKWLLEKPMLFMVSLTLFGPMSYYFGSKLSNLALSDDAVIYLILAWFFISVLIVKLYDLLVNNKLNG
ncbi:DUF2878 domain-containing protein [Oceaniserpentilla sp. 4NH20-0058]|uniref:DUF2878 domain-containing protein n=1 Tax=Oceaniserpentilla sp. 4NH20-0058 TaxID=3127660 RepID=UPI00333E25B5